MSGSRAPVELRQTIAHELRNAANAPDFYAADIALRLIEAKYGPECWATLERAKATDDFATRRMNE